MPACVTGLHARRSLDSADPRRTDRTPALVPRPAHPSAIGSPRSNRVAGRRGTNQPPDRPRFPYQSHHDWPMAVSLRAPSHPRPPPRCSPPWVKVRTPSRAGASDPRPNSAHQAPGEEALVDPHPSRRARSPSHDGPSRLEGSPYSASPHSVVPAPHRPPVRGERVHVVGLYRNPSEKAVVFSVDEKPQGQALERTPAVLPMGPNVPEGRPQDFCPPRNHRPVRGAHRPRWHGGHRVPPSASPPGVPLLPAAPR